MCVCDLNWIRDDNLRSKMAEERREKSNTQFTQESHLSFVITLIFTHTTVGRKGKTQKHTAKEIAAKHKAAKERNGAAGGGGKGAQARQAKKLATMIICKICGLQQPSVKSMSIHYDSKHPKEDWNAIKEEYEKIKNDKKEALTAGKSKKKDKKKADTSSSSSKKSSTKSAAASLASLSLGVKSQKKTKGFMAGKKKKKK